MWLWAQSSGCFRKYTRTLPLAGLTLSDGKTWDFHAEFPSPDQLPGKVSALEPSCFVRNAFT